MLVGVDRPGDDQVVAPDLLGQGHRILHRRVDRDEELVDGGVAAAQGRRQRRPDQRGGVRGRQVLGDGNDRGDPGPGGQAQGQQSGAVAHQGQRASGDFTRQGHMLGAADHIQRRLGGSAQIAAQIEDSPGRGEQLVFGQQPALGSLEQAFRDALQGAGLAGEQEQVDAGGHGRDRVDRQPGSLADGAHIHRIADHDSLKADLTAQQIFQDGR